MEREKKVEMGKLIEKETKERMMQGNNGGRSWLDCPTEK